MPSTPTAAGMSNLGSSRRDAESNTSHDRSDDDSFEDAQDSHQYSPIPTTRVERTDSKPSHGEVPGTAAYNMREHDAVPDELEIVPEGTRSRKSSHVESSNPASPVPKLVIEKVDPEHPSHGEVPGTEAYAMRKADAEPDEVKVASDTATSSLEGSPTHPLSRSQSSVREMSAKPDASAQDEAETENEEGGDPNNDFDDFAEGSGDDDDFGAFDDGDDPEPEQEETETHIRRPDPVETPPIFHFRGLSTPEDIKLASEPYISRLFPNLPTAPNEASQPSPQTTFLNERSQSLWAQLVAPPPLQPPNWVRSRTRRLFLVSLGVPIDLDEILPASKQKKLILPSIDFEQPDRLTASPQPNGAVSRLKHKNTSTTSVNSSSNSHSHSQKPDRSRRKGPPPSPQFDGNAARMLCLTTSDALHNFTPAELRAHKARLEEFKSKASECLEYWLIQRDSANGNKEAFEEVIANFVKHAKKTRT